MVAELRRLAESAERQILLIGGGDQANALYAVTSARKYIDAIERTEDKRRGTPEGEARWLADVQTVQDNLKSLPGDAQEDTLTAILAHTAEATVADTGKLASQAVQAAGSIAISAVGALPWQLKAAAVVLAIGLGVALWLRVRA